MSSKESYGYELIIDVEDCNPKLFTRYWINRYFIAICNEMGATRATKYFWDYDGCQEEKDKAPPHLKGTSAIQFLTKSDIRIHTLDDLKLIMVNVFYCDAFNWKKVAKITEGFFGGKIVRRKFISRG